MKKAWIYLIGIMVVGLFSTCSKDDNNDDSDSGKIKTENSVFVVRQNIDRGGGTVEVSGSSSPIEGLRISVPENSFDAAREFSISYSKITAHELGTYFHPVSPLIEITNGEGYSDQFMELHIPINSQADHYPMAFYYDKKSGALEALPVIRTGENYIDVAVRHFSLIVVSDIRKGDLIQLGGFHSLFDPRKNGWSFVNYGTYPEANGICAGMSIGAAYYYKNFNGGVNLFSYFDNDQLWFRTEDYWSDDSKGLRFATNIHQIHGIFWSSNNESITGMLDAPEEDRFWNLIYSMFFNNQPQLIYVKNSSIDTAHMIIGFGFTINQNEAKITVYDPNYPGLEGIIEFDMVTKKFRPYTSAANAQALENGDKFNCDKIAYVPLSSVISKDEMDFLWQKVQSGTIGDNLFPPYKVYAVPTNPEFDRVELNTQDNTVTNYIPFDEFNFEVVGLDPSISPKMEEITFQPGTGLERTVPATTVQMIQKDTLIGLYLYAIPQGQQYDKWLGFDYFKIKRQDLWVEPADTIVAVNAELKLVVRHNGSAPPRARYEWDFGDHNELNSTDTFITHKYEEPGDYIVQLVVIDLDNQKQVAEVEARVSVTIWPKIAITLKGMDFTPPSTIKASDGSDIPSISWANKGIATSPAISWNQTQFVVDFQYSLAPAVYTCRIQGTVSSDFKKITYLNAIYTGIAFGGDWNYQTAIVLQNFPLEEYIPGQIIGKTLTGLSAQPKVAQLSWKQTTRDNQGNLHEVNLQSVDWNSNQTELSVFFYNK
jgi:PKD repeat protein